MSKQMTAQEAVADLVDELHEITNKLRFGGYPPLEGYPGRSVQDDFEMAADEISHIAASLDTLVTDMDISEREWIEYTQKPTTGDTMASDDKTTGDLIKGTYEQVYNEQVKYYRENNFPSDEQFSPEVYEEKHGK